MKKLNYKILISLVILCLSLDINAQTLTGYFMNYTTNGNMYNPVFNPKSKVYVSLYDIHINAGNSAFSINNIFKNINNGEKYVIDLDKIYGNLKKKNYIFTNQEISLANFGFRINEGYVNGGISIKSNLNMSYPKDIFKLKDGTYFGENSTIDLSGINLKANLYYEFKLGYSWEYSDKISLGVNLKRIQNIANFRTKKCDIEFETNGDMYNIDLKSNIEAEFSCNTDLKFAKNENGLIDSVYSDNINIDDLNNDNIKDLLKGKNGGWATDLGITYKINNKISLAGSIIDLGFIRCKKNAKSLTQSGNFKFEGIDIAKYLNNIDTVGEILKDSILAYASPNDNDKGYTDFLNTKIYISGMYELNKYIKFGCVFRGMWYSKTFHPSLTSSVNFTIGNETQISISQSFINRKANVFGFGISQRLGYVQLHFILDQLSPALWAMKDGKIADKWIRNTNMISFQTGLSVIIGRKYYNENGYYDY
ncbi:MAG: DUF5723 family protein [Bacteroidales bacterium]|nr:DUF5723 family protein [Bacteroidales bacterium]